MIFIFEGKFQPVSLKSLISYHIGSLTKAAGIMNLKILSIHSNISMGPMKNKSCGWKACGSMLNPPFFIKVFDKKVNMNQTIDNNLVEYIYSSTATKEFHLRS